MNDQDNPYWLLGQYEVCLELGFVGHLDQSGFGKFWATLRNIHRSLRPAAFAHMRGREQSLSDQSQF
ncbi:MAG TPA: hypothetical protein VHE55_10925 [Fimbriimonadaceae bacterium]|nr:hypothetical protein [Fimbriimonadaceae bacterium]